MTRPKQAHDMATGVEGLIGGWAEAWNAHDMHRAAALVDADVDFVTVAGHWLRGRAQFLQHHQDIHRRHLRDSTWRTVAYTLRPLRDDLGLAHHEWTITGECDPTGSPLPQRSGIFTWVVSRAGPSCWLIAAAHNTNRRADTSHRRIEGGAA